MKYLRCAFVFVLMLTLSSCQFLDLLAGIERGENGEVVEVNDNPVTQIATSLLYALGGGGAIAAGATGWAIKAYRHRQIVAAGGRDDDFDGRPDPVKPAETITAKQVAEELKV